MPVSSVLFKLLRMDRSHWIVAAGWILFGVIHSAAAAGKVKSALRHYSPKLSEHYRVLYIAVAMISAALIVAYQCTLSGHVLFIATPWFYAFAVSTGIAGITIMGVVIYKYCITGVAMNDDEVKPRLITTGLHKYVRHPLYTGTILTLWSGFFIFPLLNLLISNTVITVYTIIGIHFEERKLLKLFGDNYAVYKKKVPMLIPFS